MRIKFLAILATLSVAASAHAADAVEQIGQQEWWWPYKVVFFVLIAGVAICAALAWRKHQKLQLLAAAATIALAQAQAGDALEQIGRYDATRGARDAVSYGHDYMSTHQLEMLQTLYRFSDNSSYPRQIAGDYLSAAKEAAGGASMPGDQVFGSPIMTGPLSGGYQYRTVCDY